MTSDELNGLWALRMALERGAEGDEIIALTQQLVHLLGGQRQVGQMTPVAASLYLTVLIATAP